MTNTEIIATAIVTGFGVLGAAVRLSAGVLKGVTDRVVKAIDDSTAAWTKTSETVSGLTKQLVSMEAKLDMQQNIKDAVDEVRDEISAANDVPVPPRRNTPPDGGYLMVNPKRQRGG